MVSQTCFWWPWQFPGGPVRCIVGCPLYWNLSDILLVRLGLWVWGKMSSELKHSFPHIVSRAHTMYVMYDCWRCPWPPGWGGGCQFSPLKATPPSSPPLSILCSLKGSLHAQPGLKWWRLTVLPHPFVFEVNKLPSVLFWGYLLTVSLGITYKQRKLKCFVPSGLWMMLTLSLNYLENELYPVPLFLVTGTSPPHL